MRMVGIERLRWAFIAGVVAAGAAGALAGCGDGASGTEVVELPSHILEDARRSDAAYDEASKSKSRNRRASRAEPAAPAPPP